MGALTLSVEVEGGEVAEPDAGVVAVSRLGVVLVELQLYPCSYIALPLRPHTDKGLIVA